MTKAGKEGEKKGRWPSSYKKKAGEVPEEIRRKKGRGNVKVAWRLGRRKVLQKKTEKSHTFGCGGKFH